MKKMQLTDKGLAVVLAIENGLCPRTDDGWDITRFEKFWDEYQKQLTENQVTNKSENSCDETANNSKIPIVPIFLGGIFGCILAKMILLFLKICGVL